MTNAGTLGPGLAGLCLKTVTARHSQGPPLPASATSTLPHSHGPPLPGCAIVCGIRTRRSPYPFSITSGRRELKENGQYISCASIEARMTKIIVLLNRSLVDYTNSLCKWNLE